MSDFDSAWKVDIRGDLSDLEYLAQTLITGSTTVTKTTEGDADLYIYRSSKFDACNDSREVTTIAQPLLSCLTGILFFAKSARTPLTIGSIRKKNAHGGDDTFVGLCEKLVLHDETGVLSVSSTDKFGNAIPQPVVRPRSAVLADLTESEPNIAKAMRLYAAKDANTWTGLYKLLEVIEDDLGGETQLLQTEWSTKEQRKRFKHSSGSVEVAGDAARHAVEKTTPPKNPMHLDGAIAYINYLLHAWIESKIQGD